MPAGEIGVMVITVAVVVATHNLAIGVVVGSLTGLVIFARRVAHLANVTACLDPDGGQIVYAVTGELFFASSNELVSQFNYAIDPDQVVIDLTDAHIWDASSVAALDAVEAKYAARGKTVQIIGLNPPSARMAPCPASCPAATDAARAPRADRCRACFLGAGSRVSRRCLALGDEYPVDAGQTRKVSLGLSHGDDQLGGATFDPVGRARAGCAHGDHVVAEYIRLSALSPHRRCRCTVWPVVGGGDLVVQCRVLLVVTSAARAAGEWPAGAGSPASRFCGIRRVSSRRRVAMTAPGLVLELQREWKFPRKMRTVSAIAAKQVCLYPCR
ncbi:STAS domain-containing protein [Nonomuraea sp. NPDC052265]|uniref:STAS domain-containing protein n=1 Tax=Nonomuraea sp. NPDC052265 TaxID=3364374 RepID=UPI0037CACE1D